MEQNFEELVFAVMHHPRYRRAVGMSQDLNSLEEMVATATRTRHPAYIDVASKQLEEFKAKWMVANAQGI